MQKQSINCEKKICEPHPSNYLSWLVIEHHICVYEQFKVLTRQERKNALEKRLRQFSMPDVIVELILARESGIWDAVTCMNPGESFISPRGARKVIDG